MGTKTIMKTYSENDASTLLAVELAVGSPKTLLGKRKPKLGVSKS